MKEKSQNKTRRDFLRTTGLITAGLMIPRPWVYGAEKKVKIVLRSSWQMVNIGDIAHTPGVLALLEKYIPEAEVVLWATNTHSEEAAKMECGRFPKLKIIKGYIKENGSTKITELAKALDEADFYLHGSGPSFVAAKDIKAAVKRTGKPFGIYGITFSDEQSSWIDFMNTARFVFFRDSVSLQTAKKLGMKAPIMEFGPDGAFAFDIRNDEPALRFLKENGLQKGKFACLIPRYRKTPYWKIHNRPLTPKQEISVGLNARLKDQDHLPLREAVERIIKETDLKVLLCPEDMSQMEIGKEMILDKISPEARKRVVWRPNFWMTDEALSTYLRSSGLFGLEMHSPIMCIGNGIPAIVGRFEQQTSKGYMWNDIGLNDWLFDFDQEPDRKKYADGVLKMLTDPEESHRKVLAAQKIVHERQKSTMQTLRKELGLE
ncbi:MAG: polysaccharide pyruvyl transferase family protein [Planctomycetia bacterium]|nr:polysaccharide pyruvyl transferase family protein [Planctomycetia bacterium]